jgi:ABC-type branched-subunit amino acid transport system permease subunit
LPTGRSSISRRWAASLGVGVVSRKRIVYVIASVGCAIAAGYHLQLLRVQSTAAFSVSWTVKVILIVVIGGLGRIEGPIIAVVVYFALQELLADYGSACLVTLGIFAIAIVLPRQELVAPGSAPAAAAARRPRDAFRGTSGVFG